MMFKRTKSVKLQLQDLYNRIALVYSTGLDNVAEIKRIRAQVDELARVQTQLTENFDMFKLLKTIEGRVVRLEREDEPQD